MLLSFFPLLLSAAAPMKKEAPFLLGPLQFALYLRVISKEFQFVLFYLRPSAAALIGARGMCPLPSQYYSAET